jgi:serine/threonine protein kinase
MSEDVTSLEGDDPTAAGGGPGRPSTVGSSGRYVLGPLLGRGGMADVYRAHDQTLGRDVAVKLLRDRTPDAADRTRFIAEAKTLARLNHPNLITILDAGTSEEHPFLVLQLVTGPSLSVALTQTAQGMDLERVAGIGRDIAAALAHCHTAGIIHRDVKPGNILLGHDGQALLTDFGISRLLERTLGDHTQTGFTIGTASYLAPEQVRGDELTSAVDMYALGLVLLEACSGRREYTGTPIEAAIARLHRSPQIPSTVPPPLAAVLGALTQTEPELRPTAEATVAALSSTGISSRAPSVSVPSPHLDAPGEATQPTPRLAASVAVEPRRRRPSLLAVAGWVAAAAAALSLALTLHDHTDVPATTVPGPETSAAPTPRPSNRPTAEPAAAVDSAQPAAVSTRASAATRKRRSQARSTPTVAAHSSPKKAKKSKRRSAKAIKHAAAAHGKHGKKHR